MIPQPPPGQGPIDPRGAFTPPSPMAPMPQQFAAQQSAGPYGAPPAPSGMPPMMPPMYPMMPPPPMMPFGPPPPRRGGVGRAMLWAFVLIVLVVSLLCNFLLLGGSAIGSSGSKVHDETVTEGAADQTVAIVPIVGVIDGNLARQVEEFLDQADKDKNVKAVVLQIDTPGGTVTASDEIYARLVRFKQDRKIPVIVSMGSLATSGGYYAACAADYLFAQETTLTGNIGVLMPRFNLSKLMEKYGVEENTIVSEGARFKNAGSQFSPDTPEGTKYLQGIANSMFARFKDVVSQGRKGKIASIDAVADGRAFTAAEAKQNGLVDDIGYLGSAVEYATKKAGLSKPTVIRYSHPASLFDLLGSSSTLPGTRAMGGVTVNGVNVNIDRKLLDELSAPRVLYLWRGE